MDHPEEIPMPRRASRSASCAAFSLIELLVVIAIIIVLLGLIFPVARKSKERANMLTCAHNMKTVNAGIVAFPANNDGYLPWAGNADRNWVHDWVWGGQGDKADQIMNPARWTANDFGFHPEAGSVFTLITGQPRVYETASNLPDLRQSAPNKGKPYENATYNTMEHKAFRCPSTGDVGKALRVNFSMNDAYDTQWGDGTTDDNRVANSKTSWGDMKWRAQRSPYGVRLSTIKGPSHKIMLINEDPRTMKNASFYPEGSAAGREITEGEAPHVTHDGKINMGFADGHIGQFTGDFVLSSQKNNIISPDGTLNNMQYWYAPTD
jgi:prepilin-type processing-associated H-X9-DG protein